MRALKHGVSDGVEIHEEAYMIQLDGFV